MSKKHLLKKGLSIVLAAAMLFTSVPADRTWAKEPEGEPAASGESAGGQTEGPKELCKLTFDNDDVEKQTLNAGKKAKAVAPAGFELEVKNEVDTTDLALKLDGSEQYIELTDLYDDSLLAGKDEFMISYDINNGRTATNWAFYAAPHAKNQGNPNGENYLGCLYNNNNMTVERYMNNRNNPESSKVGTAVTAGWHHCDVVVREKSTVIFVDGDMKALSSSKVKISDMLGENGVFYIGKANWGKGEFCQALIDNFTVYDGITADIADAIVAAAKEKFSLTGADAISDNIVLPDSYNGADIAWTSDKPDVIDGNGNVNSGEEDTTATLTATLSCGKYGKSESKDIAVKVLKYTPVEDSLYAQYDFEGDTVNACDEEGTDEAQAFGKAYSDYDGGVTYVEEGISGQAVKTGEYGLRLNKKNLGTDFTVSLWAKPEANFTDNDVLLFLGTDNPEQKWIGVSGDKSGPDITKIWGKGGNLNTWTTLFNQKVTINEWHNIVLVGTAGKIALYFDGVKIGEDNRSNNPLDGENGEICLAVNPWDNMFKGLIDEVKIYKAPARQKEIVDAYNQTIVNYAKDSFTLEAPDKLEADIELPAETINGVGISWTSSDNSVITDKGAVTRLVNDRTATLTAVFSKDGVKATEDYEVTVAGDESIICAMTFDGEDPLGNNATVGDKKVSKATYYVNGEAADINTVDREGYGKALSLDGSNKYLSITTADGKSLLAGKEEFTISYDIMNHRLTPASWAFYAAPYATAQDYPNEDYLGIHYNNSSMNVERYYEGRNSAKSSTAATGADKDVWHHYDVVVRKGGTLIFADGKLVSSSISPSSIADMLGTEGVLQVGKANWGNGEFCDADIDNFVIYNGIKTSNAITIMEDAKDKLTIANADFIESDIELPAYFGGADITWESGNTDVITDDGKVTRGDKAAEVTLTATIACGTSCEPYKKDIEVRVIPVGGLTMDDYLVGEYNFDGSANDKISGAAAKAVLKYNNGYPDYTGDIKYEDGISGKAVRVGDYGFKLNKNNIGKNFTVSMWVKPDGIFAENQVMLFLGHNSPEKWIGVSGKDKGGSAVMKIWGQGGALSTWTTLYTPTVNAGAWHNIVLVGTSGKLDAYYDGVKLEAAGSNTANDPLDGLNQDIYLAVNAWDSLYSGLIDDVKIYRTAVDEKYIIDSYNEYTNVIDENLVKETAENYILSCPDVLLSDLTLPAKVNDVDVTWKSDNPSAITDAGVITRGETKQEATLTATFKKGDAMATKEFNVTVASSDKKEELEAAKNALRINTFIYQDVILPATGEYDTAITWKSSDENILSSDGKLGPDRPKAGENNANITLTATLKLGGAEASQVFNVTVMAEPYGYIIGYIRGDNDRTGSLHLAYSLDGKEFKALNGNAGVLFATIDTNNGNKSLSTGIRFGGVGLFRNDDGSFGVVAPQGSGSTTYYTYSSEDLLSYTGGDLVKSGDASYDYYNSLYPTLAADTTGMTLPESAKGASVMPVTKEEYEKIIKRFDVVENTGIDTELPAVTADTEAGLKKVLPKTVKATYSDGSEAALNIKWDLDSTDMSKEGKYTLTGTIVPYDNPLIEQRADPHIKYDPEDECYYFTASYPAFNDVNHGYDRIILRKANTIQELGDSEGGIDKEITIWKAPSSGNMAKHVWAPEIHKIKGKWYVFFAAGNSDNIWAIRPYVLVCQNNDDPYNADSWKKDDGNYEIHAATSKDSKYFNNMSLDMTYFEHNKKHYVIWADIIGQSALYMQEIDPKKPWEGISDKVICLTTPEFGWERDTERVNEGPTILKHDGKIFCAFSASGTGPEYCIGMLYVDENADLMDVNSWTKLGYPLLTSSDVPGEYGPGHNSFTVDSEGNPVFVYHARSEECYQDKCEWASANSLYDPCRHARVKNVHWTEDGLPILKMSASDEVPADKRTITIDVNIENTSLKDLGIAKVTGYESSYVVTGSKITPEIEVTYKGTKLAKGTDYDVTYGENTAAGQGSITVKAVEASEFKGEQTIYFDIVNAAELKVRYEMTLTDGKVKNMAGDSAYDAIATGLTDADFTTVGNTKIMKLNGNGYLSIPKGVINDNTFTVSIVAETTKANDQWLWTIGRDSWAYAFFTPTNRSSNTKFTVAQSEVESGKTGAYSHENTIQAASTAKNGSYHIYTVVVDNDFTSMYVDGKKISSGTNPYDITSFIEGLDVIGYIGKSLYAADPLYVGAVGEFKVYDNALSDKQVAEESQSFDIDELIKADITATVLNGNKDFNNIKTNLSFPSKVGGKDIKWTVPEGQNVIDNKGRVIRPVDGSDKTVEVTASWDNGYMSLKFTFVVKAITVESILEEVELPYSTETGKEIYGNITLPKETNNGIKITWKSDSNIIDVASHENAGYDDTPAGTVTRPAEDTVVKLTAEIEVNGKKGTRDYSVKVKAAPKKLTEDDYTDYFFTYFTGEGKSNGEQIYFASSEDGLNWTDLNNGQPSLISTLGEKGVRDPYIIRSYEGDKFYIIATDLKINGNNDWGAAQTSGSQSLMVWESTDLVHWSNQRMVEVSASIDAGCTWAPEATYDPKTGEYIVYWASKVDDDSYGKQRLYYSKTRDFYSFTEPEVYIELDESSIDTTIIENNGTYYRYTKNEGGSVNEFGANSKTIFIEKSDSLLGTFTNIKSDSLNKENRGVEGPAIFKLNKDDADVDTWCLLVDNYGAGGYYPLLTTDLDSGVFTRPEAGTYKMPTDARHGTPIRITREEYCRVMGIEYTPTETSTPTPAAPSGVDLSGTKVLYEEGTVTYDEATGSVTGTNVKGLLIPLGITIPIGAPVDITVSGTASTGMRSWLSDGSEQRMSDIVNPISFDQKFTLVAEPFENGNVADHLQIKGPSYDSSFSKITITKVVVGYDPSKAPTPSPVPTEKPTKAPTKEPTPTDPAAPTQVPGATQAPGTPTQAPGTPTQAPGTATQAPGTATQAPGTATQAPSDTTSKKASVSISGKKKVKAGKKITLIAKIKNIDAKCTYKWSVNKKKIAAITQNKKKKNKASLKGKKAGTVKVTVKVMNGNKLLAKKTVKIKVLKK